MRARFTWILVLTGLLLAMPAQPAEMQLLRGHVPKAAMNLSPVGRLPASQKLKLAIGLPLRNREALTNLLQQIYDPASPNYHRYLTAAEFAERFGPTEKDYEEVAAFARTNGLTVVARHSNRTLLDVEGSVANIEKALHAKMSSYRHPTEPRDFYASEVEPALDLDVPLTAISGLDNYSLPRPRLRANLLTNWQNTVANAGSGPSGNYMGNDFRSAYVPGTSLTGNGQVVGLVQFDGYTASDITYYENLAGLPHVALTNVLLDGFSGIPTGSGGEIEVSLDIEMAISMAPGLSQIIVYEAGPFGNWHDILNRMATDNLAKQLSCSWYTPNGGADPLADQAFQQMAAQGQSFYNASGDSDAYTGLIDFPGDTPYITQVGGTTLTTSGPGGAWVSETVWNRGNGIGSGGGISTQYSIPSWQTNVNMTTNLGSTVMRNTPDVALTAENVYVRANGVNYNVGGTSCATPLWAGFTALINERAATSGRPPLGFINPEVYTIGTGSNYNASFHDITTGNNTSPQSPTRFFAVAGFDLATGWGTPAGMGLINALESGIVVSLPSGVTEGDGILVGAGQVRLPQLIATNLVLALASSDTNQIQVPSSVTVLAGQSNAVFDLTVVDDGVLDGTQTATITAAAPVYGIGSGNLAIFDNEAAGLNILLPASVAKGQGTVQGTVQVSAPVAIDAPIGLSSSGTNLVQVPTSVIVPAGQTSANFIATVLTDGRISGSQSVVVTAHVQNWTNGTASITVNDNVNLTVALPTSAWENAGILTNAGSVSIAGTSTSNQAISLVSDNPAKLTVPATVTIAAGSVSSNFNITLLDNALIDGHQTVTVTASAPGFTNGAASMLVLDDETPSIPSQPRPENLTVNVVANTGLAWNDGRSNELVFNGDFETGTLTDWVQVQSGQGSFVINDGLLDPPSPDGPLPPHAGSYSALAVQTGPGIHYMYQDIHVPSGIASATLRWAHRLRNFYTSFSPDFS